MFQTYEKVASVFKLDEGVVIANLDADKYRDLAEKYVLCLTFTYALSAFVSLSVLPSTGA